MWCSLISACNIVCRTSLGHNKTDEFEINCLLLCNDGEDKEIESRQHLTYPW